MCIRDRLRSIARHTHDQSLKNLPMMREKAFALPADGQAIGLYIQSVVKVRGVDRAATELDSILEKVKDGVLKQKLRYFRQQLEASRFFITRDPTSPSAQEGSPGKVPEPGGDEEDDQPDEPR